MAHVDGYLDRWLRPDIEHYFRGDLPSAFELRTRRGLRTGRCPRVGTAIMGR